MRKKIASLDKKYTKGRIYLISKTLSPKKYSKIIEMSRSPIIIGGCGRSGTTLLLSLLSTHPKILAIPFETYAFCPGGYDKKVSNKLPFDIVDIYSYILEYGNLEDKTRWVEKSPKNVQFVERIIEYFGSGARFLNVVRDGRDVVTSRHPEHPSEYHVPPKRWVKDVWAGREVEYHPQVLTVKYEDVVNDYRGEMRKIVDFIGEEYTDNIDQYPESSTIQDSPAWFQGARDVSRQSVQRWEKEEHSEVVSNLMELEGAQELLQHYEYI